MKTITNGTTIEVKSDSHWGDMLPAELEVIAQYVYEALFDTSNSKSVKIIIEHSTTHKLARPVTYMPNPDLAWVRLLATNRNWGIIVYEMAHEFCHILTNEYFREIHAPYNNMNQNLWVDDTICELASIYCLTEIMNRIGSSCVKPIEYSSEQFSNYNAEINRHPPNENKYNYFCIEHIASNLSDFIKKFYPVLETDSYALNKNKFFIAELVPLFRNHAAVAWPAVSRLNIRYDPNDTILQHLNKWIDDCVDKEKAFARQVVTLLGF